MRRKPRHSSLIFAIVGLAIIVSIGLIIFQSTRSVVRQFELSEISDGVYAFQEVAVSSIPAQNYTMATVRDISGNIITVRGTVRIVNQTSLAPYAIWEDRNIVNGDTITIYAPADTVQYLGTVSVGRK